MNRQITLLRRPATTDADGQPSTAWATVATLWAEIRHQTGIEAMRGDAEVSRVRASIKVRRREVFAGDRVQHGSTTYSVEAVLPDEESRQHQFLVCEVVT